MLILTAGKTEVEGVDASLSISTQPSELGMLARNPKLFDCLCDMKL